MPTPARTESPKIQTFTNPGLNDIAPSVIAWGPGTAAIHLAANLSPQRRREELERALWRIALTRPAAGAEPA